MNTQTNTAEDSGKRERERQIEAPISWTNVRSQDDDDDDDDDGNFWVRVETKRAKAGP